MRYTVVLEQEPDGGYVASVPVLPGCVSQGDSREGAWPTSTKRLNFTWRIAATLAIRSQLPRFVCDSRPQLPSSA